MIFFFFYNSGCSNFEPHILWLCLCCCVCYDDQRFYMAEMMQRIYFCKNIICFRFESNITNRRTNVGLVHYFHFLWCAIKIQFYFKISILRILVTFCHTFGWPNDLHQNQVCTGEIEVECHYRDCFLLHHYKSGKGQFCSKVNNCFLLSDEDSLKYKILIMSMYTRLL